jgi:hypothetical protein
VLLWPVLLGCSGMMALLWWWLSLVCDGWAEASAWVLMQMWMC